MTDANPDATRDVAILILAAGAATRMRGADKLLEPIDGMPILRRQTQMALVACPRVTVVLPPDRPARNKALQGLAVDLVTAQDAGLGMAESLRAGVAAIMAQRPAPALMVLPADMPGLDAVDLRSMIAASHSAPLAILRATDPDGTPGHPVIFPADLWPELLAISGDEGARAVIAAHPERLHLHALPGDHATLDLDTPEAWAAFRARG